MKNFKALWILSLAVLVSACEPVSIRYDECSLSREFRGYVERVRTSTEYIRTRRADTATPGRDGDIKRHLIDMIDQAYLDSHEQYSPPHGGETTDSFSFDEYVYSFYCTWHGDPLHESGRCSVNPGMRNSFLDWVFRYAGSKAETLLEEVLTTGSTLRPGANEATAYIADLKSLALLVSTYEDGRFEYSYVTPPLATADSDEVIALLDRIVENGRATYLAVGCSEEDAFVAY